MVQNQPYAQFDCVKIGLIQSKRPYLRVWNFTSILEML